MLNSKSLFLYSLFVVALVVHVSEAHNPNVFKQIAEECGKQEKVDIQTLKDLEMKNYENTGDNVKCFFKCTSEKLNIMQNGNIVEDKFVAAMVKLPREKATEIFKKCDAELKKELASKPNMNDCDKAFTFFLCSRKFMKPKGGKM